MDTQSLPGATEMESWRFLMQISNRSCVYIYTRLSMHVCMYLYLYFCYVMNRLYIPHIINAPPPTRSRCSEAVVGCTCGEGRGSRDVGERIPRFSSHVGFLCLVIEVMVICLLLLLLLLRILLRLFMIVVVVLVITGILSVLIAFSLMVRLVWWHRWVDVMVVGGCGLLQTSVAALYVSCLGACVVEGRFQHKLSWNLGGTPRRNP